MRLSRALILLHVIREARKAPRGVSTNWDGYWADTRVTGDAGDVMWDSSTTDEADRYVRELLAHADTGLPIVDAGCGNGRFTRALAAHFPRCVGVDLSANATSLAQRESGAIGVEFRPIDMTADGAGRELRAELGESNVFVRGVLHTLSRADRRRFADNVAELVGGAGVVLIAETNFEGSLLRYFESLGADRRGIPAPLARAISAGIPRPSAFGRVQLEGCFPEARWQRLVEETSSIRTVPMRTPDEPDSIPGHLAVLAPRSAG